MGIHSGIQSCRPGRAIRKAEAGRDDPRRQVAHRGARRRDRGLRAKANPGIARAPFGAPLARSETRILANVRSTRNVRTETVRGFGLPRGLSANGIAPAKSETVLDVRVSVRSGSGHKAGWRREVFVFARFECSGYGRRTESKGRNRNDQTGTEGAGAAAATSFDSG